VICIGGAMIVKPGVDGVDGVEGATGVAVAVGTVASVGSGISVGTTVMLGVGGSTVGTWVGDGSIVGIRVALG
jgi:hypothetical protein